MVQYRAVLVGRLVPVSAFEAVQWEIARLKAALQLNAECVASAAQAVADADAKAEALERHIAVKTSTPLPPSDELDEVAAAKVLLSFRSNAGH
jgi:hypothetical protein